MMTVEFSLRQTTPAPRWELLVRPLYFFPFYVMLFISLIPLAVFFAANLLLAFLFRRRDSRMTKVLAIAGAGYLARALSYFWCAIDERPSLVPLEETEHTGFSYKYREKASVFEVIVRVILVPVYSAVALALFLAGTFVILPLQALSILLLGQRNRVLFALSQATARALCEIYCYALIVTDERPFLSKERY